MVALLTIVLPKIITAKVYIQAQSHACYCKMQAILSWRKTIHNTQACIYVCMYMGTLENAYSCIVAIFGVCILTPFGSAPKMPLAMRCAVGTFKIIDFLLLKYTLVLNARKKI